MVRRHKRSGGACALNRKLDSGGGGRCVANFLPRNESEELPGPLDRGLDGPHSQLEEMEEEKILMSDYFVNFSSITQGGQAIVRSSCKNKQRLKLVILGPHTR